MKRDDSVLLERRKISRDLHDSSIQPYLGLKWALEAIQNTAATGRDVTEDLARLVERVDHEILLMRRYVNSLREAVPVREIDLRLAVQSQLVRWGDLYDLDIGLTTTGSDRWVSEALASSILNITNEGLSNVRRHTAALDARILLFLCPGQVRVEIVNPVASGSARGRFTPWSIDERARALGGLCRVKLDGKLATRVAVELPRIAR